MIWKCGYKVSYVVQAKEYFIKYKWFLKTPFEIMEVRKLWRHLQVHNIVTTMVVTIEFTFKSIVDRKVQ
jgi:hypothetical protein